jgi:Holliday junction resolvasome RuvABC endonuclease subunit
MRVLGLDISGVSTGWAVVDDGKVVAKGVIGFGAKGDLTAGQKQYWLRHQVAGLIHIYHPDELAIENTFMKLNFGTCKVLDRLAGAVQSLWYEIARKEAVYYYATSVRPTLGLKGNCQKEDVVARVNEFFKLRPAVTDHNEADAVAVAYHCWATRAKPEEPEAEDSFGGESSTGLGLKKRRRK